jgi:hypothetical protein
MAGAGLDMAGAGLDMAGDTEPSTAALGVIDALGVTDADATDDNCDAAGVFAFRVRHW